MKPKTQRLWFLIIGALCAASALFIVLKTLEDNIVYFYTPSDLKTKANKISSGQRIRVGGYVAKNSVITNHDQTFIEFVITDHKQSVRVFYSGTPPNLFAEEQGVVAEGVLDTENKLIADRVLAKHDENYRPPETTS